jgi:hypothetical protein
MTKMLLVCTSALLIFLVLVSGACTKSPGMSQEESRQAAEEFVKQEATFRFDGEPGTLKVTGTTSIAEGWKYTIEFDSNHAGYGNRTGQLLAEVITHHNAEIKVQNGVVKSAIMDVVWDMIKSRMIDEMEIRLAPIHEVKTFIMKSNPPQIGVYIKGGLPDGCTTVNNIEITREGNTVNLKVTVQRPKDKACPAIYTYFERDVNLGSGFTFGTTYTLRVNDYTTTFVYQ